MRELDFLHDETVIFKESLRENTQSDNGGDPMCRSGLPDKLQHP